MEMKVKNHLGQILTLDSLHFPVTNAEGLTPSAATINTSSTAVIDGTFFNSSYVNQRNIVLTITPNGDAESARLTLYKYFKPKYPLTLYIKTKSRNVYIEGYVESFEGGLYDKKQSFQISVICPQPFFNDANESITEQTTTVDGFSFPFFTPESGIELSYLISNANTPVVNSGEESTGLVIELLATDAVIEPTIYNRTTGEKFTIQIEMKAGDLIRIDTRRGKKTIIMIRGGVQTNILNRIMKDSNWFTLTTGENDFTFTCTYGTENLKIMYFVNMLYEGV